MYSKALIILFGALIAGGMIQVMSRLYLSSMQLLMIPASLVAINCFFFLRARVEWLLLAMTLNIMVGSARFFENAFININRLFGLAIVCLLFVEIVVLKKKKIQFSPLGAWICLFTIVVILSAFFAANTDTGFNELRMYIRVVLLYFLITNVIQSELWLHRFIYVLLLSGLLLTSFSVLDAYSFKSFGVPIMDKLGLTATSPELLEMIVRTRDPNRLYGAIGSTADVNYFALSLVSLLPLGFAAQKRARKHVVLFHNLCLVFILAGVVFSLSRGAILALIIAMVLLIKRSLVDKKRLVAIILFVLIWIPAFSPHTVARVYNIALLPLTGWAESSPDVQNAINRLNYIKAGAAIFVDNPIMGIGIGNFPEQYVKYAPSGAIRHERYAHNTYLQILTEMGLSGFFVFMAGVLLTFRVLAGIKKTALENGFPDFHRLSNLLEICFIAFLTAGFFVSGAIMDIFWILIGCTAALDTLIHRRSLPCPNGIFNPKTVLPSPAKSLQEQ